MYALTKMASASSLMLNSSPLHSGHVDVYACARRYSFNPYICWTVALVVPLNVASRALTASKSGSEQKSSAPTAGTKIRAGTADVPNGDSTEMTTSVTGADVNDTCHAAAEVLSAQDSCVDATSGTILRSATSSSVTCTWTTVAV